MRNLVIINFNFSNSYMISVLNGHVAPGWPYISDTGTTSPESCIFGQIVTFDALLSKLFFSISNFILDIFLNENLFKAFFLVYARYQQIKLIIILNQNIYKLRISNINYQIFNIIGYVFGLIACVGLTLVGNFQV